jgi:predicted RND superfamily exporter protein
MARTWERIGDGIGARPLTVLAVAAVASIVLAVGATGLRFATGQDSYLNRDSQVAIDHRAYQDL